MLVQFALVVDLQSIKIPLRIKRKNISVHIKHCSLFPKLFYTEDANKSSCTQISDWYISWCADIKISQFYIINSGTIPSKSSLIIYNNDLILSYIFPHAIYMPVTIVLVIILMFCSSLYSQKIQTGEHQNPTN